MNGTNKDKLGKHVILGKRNNINNRVRPNPDIVEMDQGTVSVSEFEVYSGCIRRRINEQGSQDYD